MFDIVDSIVEKNDYDYPANFQGTHDINITNLETINKIQCIDDIKNISRILLENTRYVSYDEFKSKIKIMCQELEEYINQKDKTKTSLILTIMNNSQIDLEKQIENRDYDFFEKSNFWVATSSQKLDIS
jgi:hypothetical protein